MANRSHSREYADKLIKLLKEHGWYLYKQTGGHRQFKHPTEKGKVTVPQKITKNTEISILKQARLKGKKGK